MAETVPVSVVRPSAHAVAIASEATVVAGTEHAVAPVGPIGARSPGHRHAHRRVSGSARQTQGGREGGRGKEREGGGGKKGKKKISKR